MTARSLHRRTWTVATLAIVAALALGLAACGADETDEAAERAETTAPAEEEAVEADESGDEGALEADATDDAPAEDAAQEDTEPTEEAEAETEADAGGDEPAEELGTATVEGEVYAITELIRCEPEEIAGFEYDLELIGRGEDGVQIDVYLGGVLDTDVSWNGPEGVFGGPTDAASDWEDDRVSGSATLVDAFEGDESLSITFDLHVPEDETACR